MSRMRRLVKFLLMGVLALIVLVALLFGVATLIVPQYRHEVVQRLSQQLDRPVHIHHLALGWHDWYPSFRLEGVVVSRKDGTRLVGLNAVRVGLDPLSLIQGQVRPANIMINGLAFTLVRDPRGQLYVQGLRSVQRGTGNALPAYYLSLLAGAPNVDLSNGRVHWIDHSQRYAADNVVLRDVQLHLQAGHQSRQLQAQAKLPARLGRRIDLKISLSGLRIDPALGRAAAGFG
jgi:uncharacterized protein YhdP